LPNRPEMRQTPKSARANRAGHSAACHFCRPLLGTSLDRASRHSSLGKPTPGRGTAISGGSRGVYTDAEPVDQTAAIGLCSRPPVENKRVKVIGTQFQYNDVV
jgi:hypothetical protein